MNETLWWIAQLLLIVLGLLVIGKEIIDSAKEQHREIEIQNKQNEAAMKVIKMILEELRKDKNDSK